MSWRVLAAGLLVLAGSVALSLPRLLAGQVLSPDMLEYAAIAYNWVAGAGFVDPVIHTLFLGETVPPIGGPVLRAPVISLLLAPAVALGATLPQLAMAHAAFACAIGAAGVLVASRYMSPPAALAFGIAFAWSFRWIRMSQQIVTEPIGVGMIFLLVLLAAAALRSVRGGLLFGVVAALAWLARPNLALMLPALLVAAALVSGPRNVLRSRPLGSMLLGFAALYLVCHGVVRLWTGFPPYAHYGFLLQTLDSTVAPLYAEPYAGPVAFLRSHGSEVLAGLRYNFHGVLRSFFLQPDFHYVGWLAVPALVHAFVSRGEHALERRLLALSALGFFAVVVGSWASKDPWRLAIPTAACLWLLVAWSADDVCRALAERWRVTAVRALPALGALVLFLASATGLHQISNATTSWQAYRSRGRAEPEGAWGRIAPELCDALDRDAVVAADQPWRVYLWCGNAAVWLPRDLDTPERVEAYLRDVPVGYVVTQAAGARSAFAVSADLEQIAAEKFAVYEVRAAPPASRPWSAPPPIHSMGAE